MNVSLTIPIAIMSWDQYYNKPGLWKRKEIYIIQNELYHELKPAWQNWTPRCWIEIKNDNAENLLSIIND